MNRMVQYVIMTAHLVCYLVKIF